MIRCVVFGAGGGASGFSGGANTIGETATITISCHGGGLGGRDPRVSDGFWMVMAGFRLMVRAALVSIRKRGGPQ